MTSRRFTRRTSGRSRSRGARSADWCRARGRTRRRASPVCPRQRSIIPRWKIEGRVARAEPQRPLRVGERVGAAAVAGERPREHVVAEDRRPVGPRPPCERKRFGKPDAVVDAEEGGLEIGADAVRGLQAVDRGHERVLPSRFGSLPRGSEQVAELRNQVRQRNRLDGSALERERALEPAAGRFDARQPLERAGVARESGERDLERASRFGELAEPEVELAELHQRPRRRLANAAGSIERELHRLDRLAGPPEQLTRVGDAGVAAEARLQRDLAVEGTEGLVVAAELEQRVAEQPVAACGVRRERDGAARQAERCLKVVPAGGQRGKAGERDRVAAVEQARAPKHSVGPPVVRRVGGLARPLQVREPEQRERALVVRALPHVLLEPPYRRRRVAEREAGQRPLARDGCGTGRAPRGRSGFSEHAAEEGDGGGRDRRHRTNQDPRPSHRSPTTRGGCGRSPGGARPRRGSWSGTASRSRRRRRRGGCSGSGCRARARPRGSGRTRTRVRAARCR